MSKIINSCVLLFVLLALLTTNIQGKVNPNGLSERVTITSVSTRNDVLNWEPRGSILGGTTIWITAEGHSHTPSENRIMVGPYPCLIPEKGISGNQIACVTTEAYEVEKRWKQAVILYVDRKVQSQCSGKCVFTYDDGATPFLKFIQPSVSRPGREVNWNAIWRLSNTADIKKMIIGDQNCDRFQLDQLDTPVDLNYLQVGDDISANNYANVPCRVSPKMSAGLYSVSAETVFGTPYKLAQTSMLTADGQRDYEFVVTAQIDSISSNSGAANGNRLTITGTGFGGDQSAAAIDVSGIQCNVVSLSNTEIVCDLEAQQTPAAQDGQFIAGQGVQRTLFNLSGAGSNAREFQQNLASLAQGKIVEDGIIGAWEDQWQLEDSDDNSGVWARGYFLAPRSGNYKFWLSGDDNVAVFLNTTPRTPEIGQEILYKCDYTYARNYLAPNECGYTQEQGQNLQAGEYYWVEVFAFNSGGAGSFALSVETPAPAGDALSNSVSEIQRYTIIPDNDYETYSIKMYGDVNDLFAINFRYRNNKTNKWEWNRETWEKTWEYWAQNPSTFRWQVDKAAGYYGTTIVSQHQLNAAGERITEGVAEGVEFVFEFRQYREKIAKQQPPRCNSSSNNSKCDHNREQKASPPVGGTYNIYWQGYALEVWHNGGWTTDVPAHYGAGSVKSGMIRINQQYYDIEATTVGRSYDGLQNTFFFRGPTAYGNVPNLSFDASNLTGGRDGTTPKIAFQEVVQGNDHPFYEPIPFDMSFIPANAPQVSVVINGVPSVCTGDCTYQTSEATPVLNSFSVSGFDLTLDLSGNTIAQTPLIWFGGFECENVNISNLSAVTCSVQGIEAGQNVPDVLIPGVGYASYSGAAEVSSPVVSSVSPVQGSIQGGLQITITGTGFAQSDLANTQVTFGGNAATIISTSNTSIVVQLPEGVAGDQPVVVAFNGQSNNDVTFNYMSQGLPTITSVSPVSASPVQKGTLTLNGADFGTDPNALECWLLNDRGEQVYQLNVLTANDSVATVRLSGGHVGTYTVRVINVHGYSVGNVQFEYLITIDNITPLTGSSQGGSRVVITGTNFSNSVADNAVFFFNDAGVNLQAYILSATTTELVVRAPPADPSISNSYTIVVQGRLIEEARCNGNCNFVYTSSGLPTLETPSDVKFNNGETVTLTGTNFSGNAAYIQINGEDYPATIASSTEAHFVVPDIPAGEYSFLLTLDPIGYAGGFAGQVNFAVDSVTPNTFALGGEQIVLSGSGFNAFTSVQIGESACTVVSQSSTQITCIAPPSDFPQKTTVFASQAFSSDAKCNNCVAYTDENQPVVLTASSSQGASFTATGSFTYTIQTQEFVEGTIRAFVEDVSNRSFRVEGTLAGLTATFQNVPAGVYDVRIWVSGKGYATFDAAALSQLEITLGSLSGTASTGLAGGAQLTISGTGFNSIEQSANAVYVCGTECPISSVTSSQIQCTTPRINTQYLDNESPIDAQILYQYVDDENESLLTPINVFESVTASNAQGEQGVELGLGQDLSVQGQNTCSYTWQINADSLVQVEQVEIYLQEQLTNLKTYFYNIELQGSANGSTWTTIDTFTPITYYQYGQILLGLQSDPENNARTQWRYLRVVETQDADVDAVCNYSFRIRGHVYHSSNPSTASNFNCGVQVRVNGVLNNAGSVSYQSGSTAYVDNVVPFYGSIEGGETITINGQGFGTDSSVVNVVIDGVVCNNVAAANTQITCELGVKNTTAAPSLLVTVGGNVAVNRPSAQFVYGLTWSNEATWGGEIPPREGDSVIVPAGQVIIVDESTPVLHTVIVEGGLVFADNQALEFQARYVIVRKGWFQAGRTEAPYQNELTITLHGNYWDKQLPEFGNKVLSCMNCQLNLNGQPRQYTWSLLSSTVAAGATELTVQDPVDWVVGDVIGIATTSYKTTESEKVTITAITGSTITFTPALQFEHISVKETYNGYTMPMEAEVINLSRNIRFQGAMPANEDQDYGAHLMVHGSQQAGTQARITYVEFRQTGQPRIVGRYTVHFHQLGFASNSIVQGIAVHDSHARVVAIHATNFLRVAYNVGFGAQGHNIFLEDGIETHNVIEYNVIISPISAFTMLQTDVTVAGIWVTNPTNYVRFNRVAGSEFYGMWYEIKDHPESRSDLCPEGMEVLQITDNVGHSNIRFGLRFFHLSPRRYPCEKPRNDLAAEPFAENPSIPYTLSGQISWKNGECGVLAEFVGDLTFENFLIADSYRSGFQLHVTNTTESFVTFRNSLVVGASAANGDLTPEYEASAILLPRTEGFVAENIEIHNMVQGTNIVESSSENQFIKLWTMGGYVCDISGLKVFNSPNAGKLKWQGGPLRNAVFDRDGSLLEKGVPTWYTPKYPHYDQLIADGLCEDLDATWGNTIATVACTQPLRGLRFNQMEDKDHFIAQRMKVFNLNDAVKGPKFGTADELPEFFMESDSVKIKNKPNKDMKDGFATILATNYVYNIHWNYGIDFSHTLIFPSYQSELADDTTILRFNYTEHREVFDVFEHVGGENVNQRYTGTDLSHFIDQGTGKPNNNGCVNGDFLHDEELKLIYVCVNGKQKASVQSQIGIDGIYCRDTCPNEGFTCEREDKVRYWNNADAQVESDQYTNVDLALPMVRDTEDEEWRIGKPQPGQHVRIPCEWTIVFNQADFTFNTLTVDGTLRIDDTIPETTIKANNIWIRGGKIVAGNVEKVSRFQQKLNIILTGDKNGEPLIIDDISRTGTKSMAVTGRLELYGQEPTTAFTRLVQTVNAGETTLHLLDDVSEWQAGQEVAISANEMTGLGYEKRTIQSVDAVANTITLTEGVSGWHYGHPEVTVSSSNDNAEQKIDARYNGELDMRTTVGLLSRNIRIIGSAETPEEEWWGGHVQVYHYVKTDESIGLYIDARGSAELYGVEFQHMGQHETDNAGLHILHTNLSAEEKLYTIVEGSSFHDCFGFCFNAEYADMVKIHRNVFWKGEKFLIQARDINQFEVTNNLLIGATLRLGAPSMAETSQWDPVALIHMYSDYEPAVQDHVVRNNIGSGSEGIGYAFPGTPCEFKDDTRFQFNEVGHCAYIGVLYSNKGNRCFYNSNISVYASAAGIIVNIAKADHGFVVDQYILAENKQNVILHTNSNAQVHNSFASNIWTSNFVRETCTDCYTADRNGVNTQCSGSTNMRLAVVTTGASFPWVKPPFIYDVICSAPSAFGSVHLENIEFHNVRSNYDPVQYPNAGTCGNNRVFRNHGSGAEGHPGHYLTNVSCVNCDRDTLIYLMDPRDAWRGWFGGCGNMDCTGMENMLIQDLTGDFLGHVGSIISNNEVISPAAEIQDKCTFIQAWNSYDCQSTDFTIMEWDAIGEDKQKLTPFPVSLTSDVFTNAVNMWREWEWQGPEPLNMRLNRYVGLMATNQWQNVTYSGTKSVDIVHRLGQRTAVGEIDRYEIIKYHYDNPMAIQVLVNGDLVPTFPFHRPEDLGNHLQNCGANNYYYDNSTIHFVLTNVAECSVQVRQVNSVFINMRLAMTKEDFYSDDAAQTNFQDRIAAFLHISYDRVRIVGLNNSRRMLQDGINVEFQVMEDKAPGRLENGYLPLQSYVNLRDMGQQIIDAVEAGTLNIDGQALEAYFNVIVIKEAGLDGSNEGDFVQESDILEEEENKNKDSKKISKEERDQMIAIALGIIFGLIGAILIAMIVYHFWKKRQVKQIQNLQVPQNEEAQYNEKTANHLAINETHQAGSRSDIEVNSQ